MKHAIYTAYIAPTGMEQVHALFLFPTFVIITHDPRIAEKTDCIVEIKDGRIHSDFIK